MKDLPSKPRIDERLAGPTKDEPSINDLPKGKPLEEKKGGPWLAKNVPLLMFLIALIGVPIGLWEYFEKAENDYRKPLWEKQLNYYLEATEATAKIATLQNDPSDTGKIELARARMKFWELYYGELVVVEDGDVSQAMVNFGKCLRDYQDMKCDQKHLQELSLALAKACRSSVSTSWKQPLKEINR